jgi:hypothetical protein
MGIGDQQVAMLRFGNEVNLTAGDLLLQATEEGRREDDVTDGAEANDEDLHLTG